jgi:hypothetical protein
MRNAFPFLQQKIFSWENLFFSSPVQYDIIFLFMFEIIYLSFGRTLGFDALGISE